MGERKVLTKYYPPDFDPSKIPRVKKPRDKDNAVRFMLPMSVRCETCAAFMGQGLKFNARKSNTDEDYLGVKIFRFHMRCKQCPATFTIKTDPKNSDYVCEAGVKRNYEPWRAEQNIEDAAKAEREEADQDTMVALENKMIDAKTEMEELDELDELKSIKSVQARITPDQILKMKRQQEDDAKKEVDDEAEVRIRDEAALAFARKKATILRVDQSNSCADNGGRPSGRGAFQAGLGKTSGQSQRAKFPKPLLGVKFKTKRTVIKPDSIVTGAVQDSTPAAVGGLLDYSSSEGEDSD